MYWAFSPRVFLLSLPAGATSTQDLATRILDALRSTGSLLYHDGFRFILLFLALLRTLTLLSKHGMIAKFAGKRCGGQGANRPISTLVFPSHTLTPTDQW